MVSVENEEARMVMWGDWRLATARYQFVHPASNEILVHNSPPA